LQAAYVKATLGPVHDALYDHITSRKWCLRGEYTKDDARELVKDRRNGEEFYSADFSSATDRFHLRMVAAVARLLAESPDLTDEEREAILGSFPEDSYLVQLGSCPFSEKVEIVRGQMMGNKLSFPLLCLVNRGMFLISNRIWANAMGIKGRKRSVRINGDDIAFPSDPVFSRIWEGVVSHFGMVLNRSKTMISPRYIELNSKIFDAKWDRFLLKPVLSAFRRTLTPGCVVTSLLEGLNGCKSSVVWNGLLAVRNLIRRSGVCVSTIPRPWFRRLVKCAWFRDGLRVVPVIKTRGVDRSVPHIVASVAPAEEDWELYQTLNDELTRRTVDYWVGKEVPFYRETLGKPKGFDVVTDEGALYTLKEAPSVRGVLYKQSKRLWQWVWPKLVREEWERRRLPLVECGRLGLWAPDHPHLVTKRKLVVENVGVPPTAELSAPGKGRDVHDFWQPPCTRELLAKMTRCREGLQRCGAATSGGDGLVS